MLFAGWGNFFSKDSKCTFEKEILLEHFSRRGTRHMRGCASPSVYGSVHLSVYSSSFFSKYATGLPYVCHMPYECDRVFFMKYATGLPYVCHMPYVCDGVFFLKYATSPQSGFFSESPRYLFWHPGYPIKLR